jgi:predicted NBD/HSP70 family sugar kinase
MEMARYLAIGIDAVFTMLDPECVVLTGGIMEGGGRVLLQQVRESLRETSEYGARRARDVVLSRLRRYAGIQGSACLVFASLSLPE